MPFTLPPRTPSGPRRRSLLASAAGAFVLVGCSAPEPSTVTTVRSPSAADLTRARAARDSESRGAPAAPPGTPPPPPPAPRGPPRGGGGRAPPPGGGAGPRPPAR
ncbi:hypothetical protein ACFWIZ_32725, partial [Streptomyces sp. NPDC127044]